jgi:predicted RNase H-like HicB family nuclease
MRRSRGRVIDEPMEITPEIEALARRPYRMIVWHDEENGWAAEIPDLPGLSAAGDTLEEMIAIVEEAKVLWIAAALAEGRLVPEPREELISTRR